MAESVLSPDAAEIHHTPNGWHLTLAQSRPPTHRWIVRWRTQTRLCCGRRIVVAGRRKPPVWIDFDGTDYPEVRETAAQCSGCGSLFAATFTARRCKQGDSR